MKDLRRSHAEKLFQLAADLPPGERSAFLNERCGIDASLRSEVEDLLDCLENHRVASLEEVDRLDEANLGLEGRSIGPYKLLQLIGEGGFGSVYMADQEKPIRRRVALKVIKLGMDTKKVIARFEVERQTLALMEHPNIARVLDAGTTDSGRPYFVMELVKGTPVTEFCDERNLDLSQRLELFIRICQAVQHAHQKGIIHRDIKPSNVLVSFHDGTPVPKIIDFGIAKATNKRLTEETFYTEYCYLMGTPEYMSPEQAGLNGQDIDTRTDIYSLGVLLYVLLIGRTPFDWKTLGKATYGEVQRIIREEAPPTPSHRLSRMGPELEKVARTRRLAPQVLCRTLRGDLDWIVMRALEKDRSRRYATVADFIADIRRYMKFEPVQAGPPGAAYRIGKFVRRHWIGVTATAVTVAALLAGLSLAVLGYVRATSAEASMKREAVRYAAVSDFLREMMETADPAKGMGHEVTMRRVLDEAAARIKDGYLIQQPEVEAAVRMTLGSTYKALGLYSTAEEHFRVAGDIRAYRLGEEDPETLLARSMLAEMIERQGIYVKAEGLYRQVLDVQVRVLGPEHRDTLYTMDGLGVALWRQEKFEEAETIHIETLAIQRRTLGEDHIDTMRSMAHLGTLYWHQERFDEAEDLLSRCLEKEREVLGDEHPETLKVMNNLALVKEKQGRFKEAELILRETVEIQRSILGSEHPETQRSTSNLNRLLLRSEKWRDLRKMTLDMISAQKRKAEQEDADANALNTYAWTLLTCDLPDLQNPAKALPFAKRAVELSEWKNPDILDTYALALSLTKDNDRALEVQREAVHIAFSQGSVDPAALDSRLIEYLLTKWDSSGKGWELFKGEKVPTLLKKKVFALKGPGAALFFMGRKLLAKGEIELAEVFLRECLDLRRKNLPEGHKLVIEVQQELDSCLSAAGGNF